MRDKVNTRISTTTNSTSIVTTNPADPDLETLTVPVGSATVSGTKGTPVGEALRKRGR
jgi:hypothetical protein